MMQLRETDELIEAMREQARADCLAMTRKWDHINRHMLKRRARTARRTLSGA